MNKIGYLIVFCFWAGAFFSVNGPVLTQARADFKKANQVYENQKNFSMEMQYMVFSEYETQSALEAKSGKYVKFNKNTYTKIDDIETYDFNNVLVSLNHGDKLISVGDNDAIQLDPWQTNVDSLLTLCKEIKTEMVNANERKYILLFSEADHPEFTRVDIHIDTKNYRYTRLVLFYNIALNLKSDFYAEEKQPRLEISYRNFKPLTADPLIFRESLYVAEVNGKLKPAPKYYNYRITDLRKSTRIKKTK